MPNSGCLTLLEYTHVSLAKMQQNKSTYSANNEGQTAKTKADPVIAPVI